MSIMSKKIGTASPILNKYQQTIWCCQSRAKTVDVLYNTHSSGENTCDEFCGGVAR
jgi:hypothetical protein